MRRINLALLLCALASSVAAAGAASGQLLTPLRAAEASAVLAAAAATPSDQDNDGAAAAPNTTLSARQLVAPQDVAPLDAGGGPHPGVGGWVGGARRSERRRPADWQTASRWEGALLMSALQHVRLLEVCAHQQRCSP